jgi:hypothetical protein
MGQPGEKQMLETQLGHDTIKFGEHLSVTFQRTLRIPDDGKDYPLPPGLGRFPISRVEDYAGNVPDHWREHGGVFMPMYQREAMWLSFSAAYWRPNAVKVAIGKINAITGQEWTETLQAKPQDYIVCPNQPWLDGINDGDGYIRQFVAMPLGMGYTVEGQVTGKEEFGGLQIIVFEPKPGRFPDEPPQQEGLVYPAGAMPVAAAMAPSAAGSAGAEMGLAAGGRMRQKIYPDDYGIDTWDQTNFGRVYVHIVNSMMYREITGHAPPTTPISAKEYAQHGLPWFDLYDEEKSTLTSSDTLQKVKSVKEMDEEKGFDSQQDDSSVNVPDSLIKKLGQAFKRIKDGEWI